MYRICAILLALTLAVTLLAAAIWFPATSGNLMNRLMWQYAPPEDSGLPEAEYPAMAKMIAGYLSGDGDSFQLTYAEDGVEYRAFQPHEQQHMADVQGLFDLCRTVLLAGLGVSAALTGALICLRNRRALVWLRRTMYVLLALLALVAVAAVKAFDSLFILFHEIAFTNDLWLLNPSTDMLIRLMPLEFFIAYAAIIGVCWLIGLLLVIGGSAAVQRFLPKE